jgi:hypothetical protein
VDSIDLHPEAFCNVEIPPMLTSAGSKEGSNAGT